MSLKTFVKISSVNNLSDARYCAGMYVNLMGFNLEENSKNYVSPEKYNEITGWLSGLDYVAEFNMSHPERILTYLQDYPGIKYIEIQEEIHLKMLVNTSYEIILKQTINNPEDLEDLILKSESYKSNDITLLLISESRELDETTMTKIAELAEDCLVLLGFGIEPSNIEEVLQKTNVRGIALQGGDEIKTGLKNFDELADILETLEED